MAQKPLVIGTNGYEEITPITTSAGASDAGKVPGLDGGGKWHISFMPSGLGTPTVTIVASETLAAGNFVNFWNDSGTPKVRKADAATGKRADGFVKAGVTSGASATVYGPGAINDQLSGLTAVPYRLSTTTPGAIQTGIPTGAGELYQEVGTAVSATELWFNITSTATRA